MPALPNYSEVQSRYVAFRYDGERTLSGRVMRYGDTATIYEGFQERFERGAFGDVDRADVILNRQHKRDRPLARTQGGGLQFSDNDAELRISAQIAETSEGNDSLALVRSKILRGFSVEFLVLASRREGDVTIIEEADLRGVAVVDRPAYTDALIDQRRKAEMTRQAQAEKDRKAAETRAEDGNTDIRELVELLKAQNTTANDTALEARVASLVDQRVNAAVKEALEERDQAAADLKRAQEDKEAAETRAKEEREAAEARAQEEREKIEATANRRTEVMVQFRELLPDDFAELREKDVHALLTLAVGDEVADPSERSEDYLMAKAEDILERRSQASADLTRLATPAKPSPSRRAQPQEGRPVNVLHFRQTRRTEKSH